MNGNGHNGLAEVEAPRWATLLGEWDIGPDSLVYKGGAEIFQAHGQAFPMGLVVSNRALQHGSYKVAVKFENVAEGSHFAGGLVIGYRSSDRYYIQAQFGAGRTAYSVTEFVPGFGWGVLKATGPITALQPNRDYPLEADIRGQEVRVKVDGVSVLEVLLSRPLEGKQIGLIAAGEGKVTFSQVEVTSDRPRLFVAMEYREPFDTFYQKVIKPQAESDFEVVRIDEKTGPGVIFQDMQREIAQADVVIAEITHSNPNVFYELGYAHALGKPTILLAQRGVDLPFDIRSFRVVFYDDSIGGKSRVEEDLSKHLEAIRQSVE
jgi:hypothetical protein